MSQPMHIVVSGLGAIGGYYGGMLAAYTEQMQALHTSFFMRPGEHLEQVKSQGLHISSPTIDSTVHPYRVSSVASELPTADVLFLATKSYDALENIEQLRPIITPSTAIVPLHNGLDVPSAIHQALPDNLILPGVCHITGRRTAPGEIVVRSDSNVLKFGASEALNSRISMAEWATAEWLYTLMQAAGLKCRLYREMAPYLREKFLMLSPSAAATAYFDMPIGRVQDEHNEEFRGLMSELASLYRVAGWEQDLFLEEKGYRAVEKMPREATTSMHSDILAGHRSELESLVGYVVREGQRLGVPTPLYRKMYHALLERIASASI